MDLASRYLDDGLLAVKWVKLQTTHLAAVALGQREEDLPSWDAFPATPPKDRGVLGGGWVYKRCRALMRAPPKGTSAQALHLAAALDVLMSKTGVPAVSEAFVKRALDDYWAAMTTEHAVPDPEERDRVIHVAEQLAKALFEGTQLDIEDGLPSLNASFEFGQKHGGTIGYLIEAFLLEFGDEESPVWELPVRTHGGCEEMEHLLPRDVRVRLLGLPLLDAFEMFVDQLVMGILSRGAGLTDPVTGLGRVDAKPHPIPEPLKVRIITLEEAAVLYRAKTLQNRMWRRLKEFAVFEYIGHPICVADWERHFPIPLQPGQVFNSGDFKASTDNILPEVSRAIFSAICKEVGVGWLNPTMEGTMADSAFHGVGLADLCCHELHRRGESAPQRCGQFMGSPSSFPVLCIANLAAVLASVKQGGRWVDWSVHRIRNWLKEPRPVVVNGDDLAAVMTEDQYRDWTRASSAIGLAPSLGKNYRARADLPFLMMNSQLRQPIEKDGWLTWRHLGFMNQALLLGLGRKGQDAGADLRPRMGWWDCGPRAHDLVTGVPVTVARRWMKAFVEEHACCLAKVPAPAVSLYTPVCLGGPGLPWLGPVKEFKPHIMARRFGAYVTSLSLGRRHKLLTPPQLQEETSNPWAAVLKDADEFYAAKFGTVYQVTRAAEGMNERFQWVERRQGGGLPAKLRLSFCLFVGLMRTRDRADQQAWSLRPWDADPDHSTEVETDTWNPSPSAPRPTTRVGGLCAADLGKRVADFVADRKRPRKRNLVSGYRNRLLRAAAKACGACRSGGNLSGGGGLRPMEPNELLYWAETVEAVPQWPELELPTAHQMGLRTPERLRPRSARQPTRPPAPLLQVSSKRLKVERPESLPLWGFGEEPAGWWVGQFVSKFSLEAWRQQVGVLSRDVLELLLGNVAGAR